MLSDTNAGYSMHEDFKASGQFRSCFSMSMTCGLICVSRIDLFSHQQRARLCHIDGLVHHFSEKIAKLTMRSLLLRTELKFHFYHAKKRRCYSLVTVFDNELKWAVFHCIYSLHIHGLSSIDRYAVDPTFSTKYLYVYLMKPLVDSI